MIRIGLLSLALGAVIYYAYPTFISGVSPVVASSFFFSLLLFAAFITYLIFKQENRENKINGGIILILSIALPMLWHYYDNQKSLEENHSRQYHQEEEL